MVSHDAIQKQASQNGLRIRRIAVFSEIYPIKSKKLHSKRQPSNSQKVWAVLAVQLAPKKDRAMVLPAGRRQQGKTTLGQKDFVHFAIRVLLHRRQA